MRSKLPKVLHKIAGLPMMGHSLNSASGCNPSRTVIVTGHQADRVADEAKVLSPSASCVVQEPQLGTGHAVLQAKEALADFDGDVFILFADTPLIRPETLVDMVNARAEGAAVVVLGFEAKIPGGYGRLIEGDGGLEKIVEAKDATEAELAVPLCNSGVMCVDSGTLFRLLDQVTNDNAKGEYYLTDIVGLARAEGLRCAVVRCDEAETLGVNSRVDLA
ncbi:UNVERIFIED_CONTAM: hypothetical protein GTU68_014619, partial [Idotea baltica]|nr:hypothetical protein [Idotea baltica]